MSHTLKTETLQRIIAIDGELQKMRERLDDPRLFQIYSKSLREAKTANEQVLTEILASENQNVDRWVVLKGEAISVGGGKLGTFANFLKRFQLASRHIAAVLRNDGDIGGRFSKMIEVSTSYSLDAFAPGSLKLGLSRAKVPVDVDFHQVELSQEEEFSKIKSAIKEAEDKRNLGMEAIDVLADILKIADEENKELFEQYKENFGVHGVLRIFHYVGTMLPNGIDSVGIGKTLSDVTTFSSESVKRLKTLAKDLGMEGVYVSGFGDVHMVDHLSKKIGINDISWDIEYEMKNVEAFYKEEPGVMLGKLLDMKELVQFSGKLEFNEKGVPSRLELDSIDILSASGEEEETILFS